MLNMVEYTLTKYKKGMCPRDGKIIWSYAMTREDGQKRHKTIARLCKYIMQKDPNKHEYYDGTFVEITKIRKDAAFNDSGKIIYKRTINGYTKFHRKAIQRLARYLSKRDDEYIYFGKLPLFGRGDNCYILSSRDTEILNNTDKEKVIKNKIRGQKAAITRNINKAKRIRENCKDTLIPDGYKTNKRFVSLVTNLYKQRERLTKHKTKKIQSVNTVVGGHIADISKLQKISYRSAC